jgi:hypothetical protein
MKDLNSGAITRLSVNPEGVQGDSSSTKLVVSPGAAI